MDKKTVRKVRIIQKAIGLFFILLAVICSRLSVDEPDVASIIFFPFGLYCFFTKKIWIY